MNDEYRELEQIEMDLLYKLALRITGNYFPERVKKTQGGYKMIALPDNIELFIGYADLEDKSIYQLYRMISRAIRYNQQDS